MVGRFGSRAPVVPHVTTRRSGGVFPWSHPLEWKARSHWQIALGCVGMAPPWSNRSFGPPLARAAGGAARAKADLDRRSLGLAQAAYPDWRAQPGLSGHSSRSASSRARPMNGLGGGQPLPWADRRGRGTAAAVVVARRGAAVVRGGRRGRQVGRLGRSPGVPQIGRVSGARHRSSPNPTPASGEDLVGIVPARPRR